MASYDIQMISNYDIHLAVENKDFVYLKSAQTYENSYLTRYEICAYAARKGYLDVLQWVTTHGFMLNSITWTSAIQYDQLHVLEWLHQLLNNNFGDIANQYNFGDIANQICSDAILYRQLHILEWARKHNYGWGKWSCCNAAWRGYLEILKRAKAEGAEWDEKVCTHAAGAGHLHILKWVRSQDPEPCPWNGDVCRSAATNGQLEVLQWAVANGCPWDAYAFSDAGFNGHMHVVNWILHMKLPWDIERRSKDTLIFKHYSSYRWYTKYSNNARWAEAIDVNLAECLHCVDLEQLIKTYI